MRSNPDGGIATPAYALGPEDQILIHVQDLSDIPDKPIRVDASGDIDLPLIGKIAAGGLTVDVLRQELGTRLAKYISDPQITINVVEYHSQPVSVLGQVNTPGVHQLQGPQRLLDVISAAGGLKQDAGPKLTVTRRLEWGVLPLPGARMDPSGQFSVADLAVDDLTKGLNPIDNIELRPHDVVNISKAEVVYVLGQVKKAGGFSLGAHDSISVIRALTLAEGLDHDAAPKKARILRPGVGSNSSYDTGRQVDVREILAGKAEDLQLRADDILFIPNSMTGSTIKRITEAAVQIATGVVIYR